MQFFIYLQMHKKKLREHYRQKRDALTPEQQQQWSIDIANQCLKLDIWNYSTFHLFLTIDDLKEVQTQYLLSVLQGKDKNVVVSKSNFKDASMQHMLLTDQTALVLNPYGIPEPVTGIVVPETQLDVVFIPLFCADSNGNRVGYGKGFYDRFLEQCKPSVLRIGLSYFEPIQSLIETNDNDVPLHALVTPRRIIHF